LEVSTATLDKAVALEKRKGATDSGETQQPFADIEPHPQPIDPAALLNEVSETIRRYIVLDVEQADAMALWAAYTWFIDVVKVAPLAIITAPEMACGKSQLLDLMAKIVMRPLSSNNMKSATLFRIAEKWHPSLMLDEVDLMLKSDDEIINLVNAGHHRGASQVWRLVGDNHEPKSFDVWGAKCFAGIALEKIFPPSTMSRAIVIRMRRKMAHESVTSLRHAPPDLFDTIAAKMARFAEDYRDKVRHARPLSPTLSDRAKDNWETLIAIAECAGHEWIDKAWTAALALSGDSNAQSVSNELLADIQTVFEHKRLEKISTVDLLKALCEDEEAAWCTYNRGNPLTPRQLSKRLSEYGISSKNVRLEKHGNPQKGFELSQFHDAFARYLVADK
jgi:putative DNA primase/helicase